MKEQLTVEKQAVVGMYNSENKAGRTVIERIFGVSVFKPRPVGVWCLGTDGKMYPAGEWNNTFLSQGVLVVTEETAFIIAPHVNVALQWGAMDKAKSALVSDTESLDSKAATDAMIAAYKDTHHEDNDGKIWDVYGAPAAEFCRSFSHGNIGAGSWDLPTITQLKIMHEKLDEINECLLSMDGYRLTAGWYWSSISNENNPRSAWCVAILYGGVSNGNKFGTHYVRAVSAFQL